MIRRVLLIAFSLMMVLNLTAQDQVSPYPMDRKTIQAQILNGTFDKHAYDIYVESIHQPGLPATDGDERSGNCDCYQEPDASYVQLSPNQFFPNSLDGSTGPIQIGFPFCFFGDNKTQFWINTKGTITFNGPNTTFVPEGFPSNSYSMIAGFWADIDINGGGTIYYKVTPTAVYVNFVEVGYYFQHGDKRNTFQIIMTDGTDPVIGVGNNLAFCYKDLQWAAGDWNGGQGGFGGTAAATVGANRGSGGDFFQIGRFLNNNANYDGPFGNNDGVHWLDYASFPFNACFASDNIPPIPSSEGGCDTLYVCQGDTLDIEVQFFAPENGQNVNITVDDSNAPGFTLVNSTSGVYASANGYIVGSPDNIGLHYLTFTGTDTGTPAESTTVEYVILVSDLSIPPISISGATQFCGGGSTILTASDGFTDYTWSTGCTTQDCEVFNDGEVTVTGFIQGCENSATVDVDEIDYFIVQLEPYVQPICSNDSTLVCIDFDDVDDYVSYAWDVYQDYPGTTYGDTTQACAYLSAGTFVVQVETPGGCIGQRIFTISATDAVIPEDEFSGAYCDGLEPVDFCCGYATAQSGNFWLYMFNTGCGWAGANGSLDVYVDGELVLDNVQAPNCNTSLWTPSTLVNYGEFIEIYYNPGNSPGNQTLSIWNCTNNPLLITPVPLDPNGGLIWSGYSGCPSTPAAGNWEVLNGPDGWSFSTETQFNTSFTPGDYGVYDLHFFSSTCGIDYYYELEYNQAPSVSVEEESLTLCDGDTYQLVADVTDLLGLGSVIWTPGDVEGNTITAGQNANYTVTVTNNCGTADDSVEVVALNTPAPSLQNQAVCDGGSVVLDPIANNDPSFEYDWSGNLPDAAEVTITEPGFYSVTVSNECGAASASSTVTIQATPQAVLSDQIACDGETIVLDPITNDDPSFQYSWSNNLPANPTASVNATGTYTVTVSNDCGSSTASAEVEAQITPNGFLQDETICNGGTATLDPVAFDIAYFEYSWSNGLPSNPEVTVDETGSYTVTISSACGEVTVSADITIEPAIVFDLDDALICNGESATLSVPSNLGGIVWSNGETDNSITVDQPGTYSATITNECESVTDEAVVTLGVAPSVLIGIDTLFICPGIVEEIDQLTYGGDIDLYVWTINDDFFSGQARPDFISEDIPGEFVNSWVTAEITVNGPCGTASDDVILKPTICSIWEYNVFTPNNDGINDFFTIGGLYFFDAVKLRVFNRWGNLVYESEAYKNDWDGGDNPEGTYYFTIELPNGTSESGSVTLLRGN